MLKSVPQVTPMDPSAPFPPSLPTAARADLQQDRKIEAITLVCEGDCPARDGAVPLPQEQEVIARMHSFESERLRLRPLTPEDAPFILELLNEPAFIQNIADKGVRTLEAARDYILNGPMASYGRHGFGLFAVERKEPGSPIGICGLIKREGLDDVDIGFALLARHWSKGYAVEAAAATLAYGLRTLGLPRIVAITAPGNQGSIRVLERIGMRFEGMLDLPLYGGENRLFTTEPARAER
jgi:RimJ/RimL family protein N-acetyltransferase